MAWPEFAADLQKELNPPDTSCSTCQSLLSGLAGSPSFSVRTPAAPCRDVRDHVDALARSLFPSRKVVNDLGYPIGKARWEKAAYEKEEVNRGGRPSKVNNEACIAAAQSALQKFSQDSSNICQNADGEWTVSRTLTKDRSTIYEAEPDVYSQMSAATFRRIMKQHLCHFKKARAKSDMCQYCLDYDRKILPMSARIMAEQRQQLEAIMPTYFVAWDAYLQSLPDLDERPALLLEQLEHYVHRHQEKTPCRTHRGTSFPCGQHPLRTRAHGFPHGRQVELHGLEAACALELRSLLKLVLSYNHHKAANEHQSPILQQLQDKPPDGWLAVVSDWKELISLPISHCASGEQFYASARMEMSTWGACVVEGRAGEAPKRTYYLDHPTNFLYKIATVGPLYKLIFCTAFFGDSEACWQWALTL